MQIKVLLLDIIIYNHLNLCKQIVLNKIILVNGTYASMLSQKNRTFPSVSGKNRNMHNVHKWWFNSAKKKTLIGKIKSCPLCEHPCHLKENEEKLCLEMP